MSIRSAARPTALPGESPRQMSSLYEALATASSFEAASALGEEEQVDCRFRLLTAYKTRSTRLEIPSL
jgi:hypothetical protein